MPLITKDFEVCDVCYYEHLLVIIRFPDGSIMRICEECLAGIILNKQKLEQELAALRNIVNDETCIRCRALDGEYCHGVEKLEENLATANDTIKDLRERGDDVISLKTLELREELTALQKKAANYPKIETMVQAADYLEAENVMLEKDLAAALKELAELKLVAEGKLTTVDEGHEIEKLKQELAANKEQVEWANKVIEKHDEWKVIYEAELAASQKNEIRYEQQWRITLSRLDEALAIINEWESSPGHPLNTAKLTKLFYVMEKVRGVLKPEGGEQEQ